MKDTNDALTATLVANHRRFVAFLKKRLGDEELADEILQAAYVKAVEKGGQLREGESAVAWFYRLLRNAVTDHRRRNAAEKRRIEKKGRETPEAVLDEVTTKRVICACMNDLVPLLKPEYATILRRADLDEVPLAELAKEEGITANNAGVRLHRARKALKKKLEMVCGTCTEHGCLDCHCKG